MSPHQHDHQRVQLTFRPIFHLKAYAENISKGTCTRTRAHERVSKGELILYFVGGATASLLAEKGRDDKGEELLQGETSYRVLNILDGLDSESLLLTIKDTLIKNELK